MTKRILLVTTNVDCYEADPGDETELWLAELAHGFEQTIVTPSGAKLPLEPRSLNFPSYGRSAKTRHEDSKEMALSEHVLSP